MRVFKAVPRFIIFCVSLFGCESAKTEIPSFSLPGTRIIGDIADAIGGTVRNWKVPIDAKKASEAEILDFSIQIKNSRVELDRAKRIVTIDVPLIPMERIEPLVAISEGATLKKNPLVDDTSVDYSVLAENGTTMAIWKVFTHRRPGMSFSIDGEDILLEHGPVSPEEDPASKDKGGKAVWSFSPELTEGYTAVFAYSKDAGFGSIRTGEGLSGEFAVSALLFEGSGKGSHAIPNHGFFYVHAKNMSDAASFPDIYWEGAKGEVDVTEYNGSEGYLSGAFRVDARDDSDNNKIVTGFFKALWAEPEVFLMNAPSF